MPNPSCLLCWPYYRKDWIQPFLKLKDKVDFSFISYVSRKEDSTTMDFPVYYWSDFRSGQQVLKKIRPDRVVFMSIDTGLAIALNMACRDLGIPTAVLQHGLFHDYNFYLRQETLSRSLGGPSQVRTPGGWNTLNFLMKSITASQIGELPALFRFFYLLRKKGMQVALKKVNSPSLLADQYWCYTRFNARIHLERERVPEDRLRFIGNPAYDSFFEARTSDFGNSSYMLLIDQPFHKNPFSKQAITEQDQVEFYRKLQKVAEGQGCVLKVKLHPENYGEADPIQDPQIEFVRDTELVPLIMESQACFGTYSNIIIPAVYFKNTWLFRVTPTETQEDMIRSGLVGVSDYFDFKPSDIDFSVIQKDEKPLKDFEQKYFYLADGRSHDRLLEALLN